MPDSGIGHTQDNTTDRTNEVWWEPDTYQPTSSQPIGRKRQAGDRLDTRPGLDREVRREGRHPALPSASMPPRETRHHMAARTGPPLDIRHPEATSAGPPLRRYQTTCYLVYPNRIRHAFVGYPTRSVARLQKQLAEYQKEFGYGGTRGPANSSQTFAWTGRRLCLLSCPDISLIWIKCAKIAESGLGPCKSGNCTHCGKHIQHNLYRLEGDGARLC